MKTTVGRAKLLGSVRTLPPGLSLHAWAHIPVRWKHQPCPAGRRCWPPLAASPCCQLLPAALHGALTPHDIVVVLAPHCSPSPGSLGGVLAEGDASPPNLVTAWFCSARLFPCSLGMPVTGKRGAWALVGKHGMGTATSWACPQQPKTAESWCGCITPSPPRKMVGKGDTEQQRSFQLSITSAKQSPV